jgi:hypothetical protein
MGGRRGERKKDVAVAIAAADVSRRKWEWVMGFSVPAAVTADSVRFWRSGQRRARSVGRQPGIFPPNFGI